jgi:hypothetical protein
MDFNSFLGKLDESNGSGFRSFSGKALYEAGVPGATADITADWFYVPEKIYKNSRHVVVEKGNEWSLYWLVPYGKSSGRINQDAVDAAADEFGYRSAETGLPVGEARDLEKLVNYLMEAAPVSKTASEAVAQGFHVTGSGELNADISGWKFMPSMTVTGDFGTVLKACVELVQAG